jgi:hypothetical protein
VKCVGLTTLREYWYNISALKIKAERSFNILAPQFYISFKWITNLMQKFFSLLSWRLFTAQHVSGIFPPIIRSSMTAVAASGFTFVSWWQIETCWAVNKCQDNKLKNCCIMLVIYLNCTMMHGLTKLKFYI